MSVNLSLNSGTTPLQNDFSFVNVGSFGAVPLKEYGSAISEMPSTAMTDISSMNKYLLVIIIIVALIAGYYILV